MQVPMKLAIDKTSLKSDIDFSKNIIENIFKKVENPVEVAAFPKLNNAEKAEMIKMSEAVGEITGLEELVINPSRPEAAASKSNTLSEQAITLMETSNIPDHILDKMINVIATHERTEKIILQFLKKYR